LLKGQRVTAKISLATKVATTARAEKMFNGERQRERTKHSDPAIKILPGHVATVRIRCGKANCRCARGDRHIAHYHVTYFAGVRSRKYVRRDQVQEIRAACEAHRVLQAELRAGRAEYKQTLAKMRELIRGSWQ
jgi:hypothetical protein